MQTCKFPLWICCLALCGGMTLHADDTPAQAAARAALNQKMNEIEGKSSPAPKAAAPAASTPAPAAAAPAAAAKSTSAPVAAQPGDNEAQARARAALNQKYADMGVPPPAAATTTAQPIMVTPATAPVVIQPGDTEAQARARAAMNQNMVKMGAPASSIPATIGAPPLPIKMDKYEKLQWLLSLYKADQISPEQYQTQRAAILAEP